VAIDKSAEPFTYAQDVNPELIVDIEFDSELQVPSITEEENGGVLIDLDGGTDVEYEVDESFGANLAESIDEDRLDLLASDIIGQFNSDINSRKDWADTYVRGLKYLGFDVKEKNDPWEGACSVIHPLISEAVVRFQSQAITELMPADGPVKVKLVGIQDDEKLGQANRVKDYMNYTLTERITDYRPETEKMLFGLGVTGSAFKKVYYDSIRDIPVSEFVPAEDLVVNYGAKNLQTAERITHVVKVYENDFKKHVARGFYRNAEMSDPVNFQSDIEREKDRLNGTTPVDYSDGRYTLLEHHCEYDLYGYEDKDEEGEETGIGLPYVVTVCMSSNKVLSIRRNWEEGDEKKLKLNHFVQYEYVPGTGFYGFGLTHLVGGIAESSTSILQQLVDAGVLSNLPGGLKAKGMRIQGDDTPIAPAEWRDVDIGGGSIRDNIFPLPYKEPSMVLLTLLKGMVEDGRRFASLNDIQASEMNNQAPVGTTLAIIERTMKVMTAIFARLHASARREYNLLSDVIRDYEGPEYPYDLGSNTDKKLDDFSAQVDVLPVSDPNASTMAQRIMQSQNVLQLVQMKPEIYDIRKIHKQMLTAMNVPDVDEYIPAEESEEPKDPATENMYMIMGKPTKVFMWQDHEAHIITHMTAAEDPKLVGALSMSPAAPAMQAALAAHVTEHVAYLYRRTIEENMGIPMPSPDEELPKSIEMAFSKVVAEAAKKTLQSSIAEIQNQKMNAEAEDPLLKMQERELAIKEMDAQRRSSESQQKLQLDTLKIVSDIGFKEKESEIDEIEVAINIITKMLEQSASNSNEQAKLQIESAKAGVETIKMVLSGFDSIKDLGIVGENK
tara:strand:+ start:960 stop:3476 length:2517 start_codon:yes stop_codon:yes gene_type:complete